MTTLVPDPHRNILVKLTEQQIKDIDIVAKHDGFNTRMAFIRRILLKQIDLHKQKHPEWFSAAPKPQESQLSYETLDNH